MPPQQKLWDWCLNKTADQSLSKYDGEVHLAMNPIDALELYTQKLLELAEWANDNAAHLGKSKWEMLSGNEYIKYTTAELFGFWIENELKLK